MCDKLVRLHFAFISLYVLYQKVYLRYKTYYRYKLYCHYSEKTNAQFSFLFYFKIPGVLVQILFIVYNLQSGIENYTNAA
jgi:hypothetical protein